MNSMEAATKSVVSDKVVRSFLGDAQELKQISGRVSNYAHQALFFLENHHRPQNECQTVSFPFRQKLLDKQIGHLHRKPGVCFSLSVQCPGEPGGQELTSSIVIIRVPWDPASKSL